MDAAFPDERIYTKSAVPSYWATCYERVDIFIGIERDAMIWNSPHTLVYGVQQVPARYLLGSILL